MIGMVNEAPIFVPRDENIISQGELSLHVPSSSLSSAV